MDEEDATQDLAGQDLACNELVELVTDYLEGALEPGERARFDDHLTICPGCEAYLEQMRHTIAMTGQLRVTDVPGDALDELVHAFRAWRAPKVRVPGVGVTAW